MNPENPNQTVERLTQQAQVVYIDSKPFSSADLKPVVDRRTPTAISLVTLTGVADFFKANVDGLNAKEMTCVINGPDELSIMSKIAPELKARTSVVEVEMMKCGHQFPFGQHLEHEDFIIKVKSLFVENEDQKRLLAFVSRLSIQNNVVTQDDGVSQIAATTKGISGALKQNEVVPSMLQLKPYRTFNEIDQPESTFLFRLRAQGERVPVCALFEADGGAWKAKAMKSIKQYLNDNVPDLTVIA